MRLIEAQELRNYAYAGKAIGVLKDIAILKSMLPKPDDGQKAGA